MTPEQAVLERLVDCSGVTDLVGSRIYLLKLPQRPTLPAIRIQRISSPRFQHLRGPLYPARSRVQVDTFAAESSGGNAHAQATAVAEAVRGDGLGPGASGLWGWKGELGSPAEFRVLNIEVAFDGDPEYLADELRAVRIRQDYFVHWSAVS